MQTRHIDKAAPLIEYIRRHVTLSNSEEEFLRSKLMYRNYGKGEFIVQQGDICRYESFIIKGCIKVFHIDPNGEQHVVMLGMENWWVGDLGSFINQSPSDYNIQCMEACKLIHFTPEDLEELYSRIPSMERFFRIIIQKAFVASQKRLIYNHWLPAKNRYLLLRSTYPELLQRVPQYVIASYLGITKEFLSKLKSQLLTEK